MQHNAEAICQSHETETVKTTTDVGIGLRLRTQRLELNYSVQHIAALTKIQSSFIVALEEERFDVLPGQVYVIGFLKTYARALGLPVCMVDEFFAHPNDTAAQVKQNYKMYLPRENKNFLSLTVAIVALLLFFVGGIVIYYTKYLLSESNEVPLNINVTSIQNPDERADGGGEPTAVDFEPEEDSLIREDDVDLHISDDADTVMQEEEMVSLDE